MLPESNQKSIPSVAELNQDVESFVIQASAARTMFFNDSYQPLQFVHFSDVHAVPELWERIVAYINRYHEFIPFALHTGDYCGGSQQEYVDFYHECTPCVRPILNCVGNHDTRESDEHPTSKKETVHGLLFGKKAEWDAAFMPGENSMTYYKDFPQANVRLVVLDCYFDVPQQLVWLKQVLEQAREKGFHVITASHEITHPIVKKQPVTFQTLDDFESLGGNRVKHPFDEVIAGFKASGGIHICHLAGHEHSDMFGYTQRGVLNVAVECATNWPHWCDGKRIRGSRTYDCFNVVSVDVNQNLLKLVRIGNNADHYLRIKRVLCYDYKKNSVIYNG